MRGTTIFVNFAEGVLNVRNVHGQSLQAQPRKLEPEALEVEYLGFRQVPHDINVKVRVGVAALLHRLPKHLVKPRFRAGTRDHEVILVKIQGFRV